MRLSTRRCCLAILLGGVCYLCFGGYDRLQLAWHTAWVSPEFGMAAGFGGRQAVMCLTFSQDGRLLVAGTMGGTLVAWEVPTGRVAWSDHGYGWVDAVVFSRADDTLAVWGCRRGAELATVSVWDGSQGVMGRVLLRGGDYRSLLFGPDGRWLACGKWLADSDSPGTSVVSSDSGEPLALLTAPVSVGALALSRDGRLLAIGGGDTSRGDEPPQVAFWEVEGWRRVEGSARNRALGWAPPAQFVRALAFDARSGKLAIAGETKDISVWDVHGDRQTDLKGHEGWVFGLAFGVNGQLVSGSSDRTVRVWDVQAGKCLRTLRGHWGDVNDVRVSPDGEIAASASNDGTVRLWTMRSGRCRAVLRAPGAAPRP